MNLKKWTPKKKQSSKQELKVTKKIKNQTILDENILSDNNISDSTLDSAVFYNNSPEDMTLQDKVASSGPVDNSAIPTHIDIMPNINQNDKIKQNDNIINQNDKIKQNDNIINQNDKIKQNDNIINQNDKIKQNDKVQINIIELANNEDDNTSQIRMPFSDHLCQTPQSYPTEEIYKTFDSSFKLSDNPFDVFTNKIIKKSENIKSVEKSYKSNITEEKLLSRLNKPKKVLNFEKLKIKEGVFQKIKILSKNEIFLPVKKYYKFPFEMSLLNDESELFFKLKNTFTSAMACAYSNFRKFGESFVVIFLNDIFVFSKELKCTNGCLKLLKSNDISFIEKSDCILINDEDKALVYDIIMNTEIQKGKPLPFILSEFEFDNGIVYRTKLIKGPVVKIDKKIEYSYVLNGPFYSSDFNFDQDFEIDYFT
jgi:hypothetical protein